MYDGSAAERPGTKRDVGRDIKDAKHERDHARASPATRSRGPRDIATECPFPMARAGPAGLEAATRHAHIPEVA